MVAGISFPVTQAAGVGRYTLSTSNLSCGPLECTECFDVQARTACSWSARVSVGWIRFTASTQAVGNATVCFTTEANPNCIPRTGTITVHGNTTNLLLQVVQAAGVGTYSLPSQAATVSGILSTNSLGINAGLGCAWEATTGAPWIRFLSSPGGTGSGGVAYEVAENPDCIPRSTNIVVTGSSTTLVFTVSQLGGPGRYSFAPPTVLHPAPLSTGLV